MDNTNQNPVNPTQPVQDPATTPGTVPPMGGTTPEPTAPVTPPAPVEPVGTPAPTVPGTDQPTTPEPVGTPGQPPKTGAF